MRSESKPVYRSLAGKITRERPQSEEFRIEKTDSRLERGDRFGGHIQHLKLLVHIIKHKVPGGRRIVIIRGQYISPERLQRPVRFAAFERNDGQAVELGLIPVSDRKADALGGTITQKRVDVVFPIRVGRKRPAR